MNLYKWIREKEKSKEAYVNILKYKCEVLDNNPSNPKIHLIQDNLPLLKRRIEYLSEKIGIGFFAFNYHTPYSSEQKIKKQLPIHSKLLQTQKR